MRHIRFGMYLLLVSSYIHAASIDGTVSPQWVTTTPTFANGDFARGFVKFTQGFSVDAGAVVTMNVTESVAGQINLNSTGAIILEGDMHLAANATLAAGGGRIAPQNGAAIFLDGNLSVPAGTVLDIRDNTIIDGQGHELILENGNFGGVILINGPDHTTLTLRNMTLRGVRDYPGNIPSILFGSGLKQNLVLENVTVWVDDTYIFFGGNLLINGEVKLMGPHVFAYLSPNNLTINNDSTLFIDLDTVFHYAPTDRFSKHLHFESSTSRLFLNGCTVFAPNDTGLTLTNGHLIVDHRTVLASDGLADPDPQSTAFNFGTAYPDPNTNLTIDILPGAQLECSNGLFVYNNKN